MYYIATDRFGNYDLCHHGIKGQRWGIRRFQNSDGSLTAAGKDRYGIQGGSSKQADPHNRKGDRKELAKLLGYVAGSAGLTAAQVGVAVSTGFLSPATLVSSAGMTVASLGLLGARSVQAGKAAVNEILSNKRLANAPIDSKSGYKKKTREWSEEEDAKAINPGFNNFNSNTKNNCVLCSVAYDLRRRGLDVVAGKAGKGFTDEEQETFYKNAKKEQITENSFKALSDRYRRKNIDPIGRQKDVKDIINRTESYLSKQPAGARGLLSYYFTPTNGHAIAYQVTKDGVKFYDCQSGKTLSLHDIGNKAISTSCMRLDNLQPDYDALRKNGVIR